MNFERDSKETYATAGRQGRGDYTVWCVPKGDVLAVEKIDQDCEAANDVKVE